MATAGIRAKQRAEAVQRLTTAADNAADALGVARAEIPDRHKDPEYLPTLQIDAVAALLERIAGAAQPAAAADEPDAKPARKAAPKKDAQP